MPQTVSPNPANISVNLDDGELVRINADELALRAAPGTSGTILKYISYGTILSRLEKATTKVDGYYWDRVSTPYGYGYIARETSNGSKLWLVPVEDTPDYGSNNSISEPDSNNIIKAEPNATVDKIKEKYSSAIIVDNNGVEITGTTPVGTGAKVKIDGEEKYTIVKLGDVSGDGEIKSKDYMMIKNYIMGTLTLTDVQKKAADVSKDEEIKSKDYMMIKNHIMGTAAITL